MKEYTIETEKKNEKPVTEIYENGEKYPWSEESLREEYRQLVALQKNIIENDSGIEKIVTTINYK